MTKEIDRFLYVPLWNAYQILFSYVPLWNAYQKTRRHGILLSGRSCALRLQAAERQQELICDGIYTIVQKCSPFGPPCSPPLFFANLVFWVIIFFGWKLNLFFCAHFSCDVHRKGTQDEVALIDGKDEETGQEIGQHFVSVRFQEKKCESKGRAL